MVVQIAVVPAEGDSFTEAEYRVYRKRTKSISRAVSLKRIKSITSARPVTPVRRVKRVRLRFREADAVPGWFDRWHFFREVTESRASIWKMSVITGNVKGYRQIIQGIALHACVTTGLVGLVLFVEPVAHGLQQALQSSSSAGYGIRLGLAAAAMLELVLFKLVFTVPTLRVLVFAVYTATLALLIATMVMLEHIPSTMLTLGIIAGSWCMRACVSLLPVREDAFTACVVGIPSVIASCAMFILMYVTPDGWPVSLGLGAVWELSAPFAWHIEVERLGQTLSLQEAHWGVYFVHIDLFVVCVLQFPFYGSYGLWLLFEYCVLLPVFIPLYCACTKTKSDDDEEEEEVEYYE